MRTVIRRTGGLLAATCAAFAMFGASPAYAKTELCDNYGVCVPDICGEDPNTPEPAHDVCPSEGICFTYPVAGRKCVGEPPPVG